MAKNTIFVVLCDWYWDCSGAEHEMNAFSNEKDAKAFMEMQAQKWAEENRSSFDDDTFITEKEENEISYYEDGWYDTCHIHWEVKELEVK